MKEHAHASPHISSVTRSRAQARASYDKLSRWYDFLAGSERPFAEAGVRCLAPVPGDKILEIGYGTGHALLALARAVGLTGKVYGVDISVGMRAVAEERLERAGLTAQVQLMTGDACGLPFASGALDGIFMSFTLELFDTPEIPLVLDECRRVLRANGRICVVAMAAEEQPRLAAVLYEWVHERIPSVVDCRPIMVAQSLEAATFGVTATTRLHTWGLPLDICTARR